MADAPDPVAAGPVKKKRGPVVAILVLAVLLAPPGAYLAYCALARARPSSAVPAGFSAYASLPSAGAFARSALDLKALDALLSDPSAASARGLLRALRAEPFLRSAAFLRAADVRADAAAYPDGSFVAVADLGARSAAVRLAPLAARLFPAVLSSVKGLSFEPDASPPRFEYRSAGTVLFAAPKGNLLVIASTEDLLRSALAGAVPEEAAAVEAALGRPAALREGSADIRILADLGRLAAAGEGAYGELLAGIDFPGLSAVDILLAQDRLALAVEVPVAARDDSLAALLARRSATPGYLTRLPASAAYFSGLSAGPPAAVLEAAFPFLGPDAAAAYASADQASAAAFGMGLDEIVFSWAGDEMGVFGSDLGPEPVFFVSVKDEKARKRVFDKAFSSLVAGRDISAVVDGERIPRAVFPPFLHFFLEKLGIPLAEPFFLVEDGMLYASVGAETLAASVREVRERRLLVTADRWKDVASKASPESAASVFYTLDRSLPFFVRGIGGLEAALAAYRRGYASVRSNGRTVAVELRAVAAAREGPVPVPGYPVRAGGRIDSDLACLRSADGRPFAYWTEGRTLRGLDLAGGARFELRLDDEPRLAVDGAAGIVWAVSARGTAYRCDAELRPAPGFPVVTGSSPSGPPALFRGELVVPVSDADALMSVAADGAFRFSPSLHARLRSAVAAFEGGEPAGEFAAVLPRSFDSRLYLLGADLAAPPSWPVELPSIASAPPTFARQRGGSPAVAAITEAGDVFLVGFDGSPSPGFPLRLEGSFDAAPAWAERRGALFLHSIEGILFRVAPDGSDVRSVEVPRGAGRGRSVSVKDVDGDGLEEVFVSGGGDALHAYDGDLRPLAGFPLPGSGAPLFIDVDGDGRDELVVRGADDTVRAYSL